MIGSAIEQQEAVMAIICAERELQFFQPNGVFWIVTFLRIPQKYLVVSTLEPILANSKKEENGDYRAIKSAKKTVKEDLNQKRVKPFL